MQGVGGITQWGAGYPYARASSDPTSSPSSTDPTSGASSATTTNPFSGQAGVAAILGNGEQVTGGVTATLPNGLTLGIWSFAPVGSTQTNSGQDASGSDGSTTTGSTSGPDYAYMESALEQMVDDFMGSMGGGAATAAAQQAYGAATSASSGSSQTSGSSVTA